MRAIHLVLAVLLIVTAIGTALYWQNYFVAGDVQVLTDPGYTKFEDSFPLADAWMSVCAVLAGLGLILDRPFGVRFGLLAGSALIFLAAMDITYNIENGLYSLEPLSAAMGFEVLINVWTLALGLAAILICWRSRQA
jgi:hypothetical protein